MIHGDAARSTGITEAASYAALIAGFTTACIVLCGLSARQQRRRLVKLEEEVKRQVALRNGEHAGRVKAEKVRQLHEARFRRDDYASCEHDFEIPLGVEDLAIKVVRSCQSCGSATSTPTSPTSNCTS